MSSEKTIVAIVSLFFGAKLKGLCLEAGYEYKGAIGPAGAVKKIESTAYRLHNHLSEKSTPGLVSCKMEPICYPEITAHSS